MPASIPSRRATRPIVAAVAAAAPLLCVSPAAARTLEVGTGREFRLPSEAAAAVRDGDTVRIAPGDYVDCATWRASGITVEGTENPASVVIRDRSCGGKALFITEGAGITVRNLTLAGAHVPDGNGAGIRAEGNGLTVDAVRFIGNQNGILSAPLEGGRITVRNSLFERNGACEPGKGCAHGIYAGRIALLRVEGSTFSGTRHGHHVKSRAARTEVVGCTVRDGPDGTASYLIEAPNGGDLVVRDSTLEKGPAAENVTAAIVIGSEGATQPTPEIVVENNAFRNDGPSTASFVSNSTTTPAMLRGNRLSGPVRPLSGAGRVVP